MSTDYRFVSCAETAKLIRPVLKRNFPRTKFSVRSHVYAGGASITIYWTDGPTPKLVEGVTSAFAGGGFDGMIDMAYSKYSWLATDGTATVAKIKGTMGSAGSVDSEQYLQPSFKAELVRFGSDYVFTSRSYSPGFYHRAMQKIAQRYGAPLEMKVSDHGTPMLVCDPMIRDANEYASHLVGRELARRMIAEG